jgi:anti-sigma factor RsiW
MKPCSEKRKLIAWLALNELDARQTRELRAHLETCEGCRRYLEEISNVAERLAAAETSEDIQVSESFHRKVVARLRREESVSVWETVWVCLRTTLLSWRLALPVIAASVVLIAVLVARERRVGDGVSLRTRSSAHAVVAPSLSSDLPPTIANYQMVASQSLEKLDELLTKQGNRNLPVTQTYTASALMRADVLD